MAARDTFLEWEFHQPPSERASAMTKQETPLNQDMQYLLGRIDALTALVLAVAGETMSREGFRQAGNARLENLEGTLLNTTATERHLLGVTHTRDWLNHVTS